VPIFFKSRGAGSPQSLLCGVRLRVRASSPAPVAPIGAAFFISFCGDRLDGRFFVF